MKVYIVSTGMRYEGGSPRSVHKTYESAKKAALEIPSYFGENHHWEAAENEENVWLDGCDYVCIKEFEVQK